VREFPELTLYVQVGGHLSLPTLELSGEPGTYTQGQLFGFLLGGSPGGAPGDETRDAAAGVASSIVSQKVTGYVNKVIPVHIDTLRYSAATATESAAFVLGRWFGPKLYAEFRRRSGARPDENTNEAQLEYWLSRTLLLQGTAGDRGVAGIDLLWIRRW
jgi:autotransporter translocation and assembly factor TamB